MSIISAGLPIGVVMLLDATQPKTILLSGSTPAPGLNLDTWGVSVQATIIDQPFYDQIGLAGGPDVVVGGQGQPLVSTPSWLTIPVLPGFQFPCTIFGVISCDTASTIFEFSTNASSAPGIALRSDNTNTVVATNGSGTRTGVAASNWASDNALCYFELYCDGTNVVLRKNGTIVPLTPSGTAPGVGAIASIGYVGTDHAQASPSSMRIGCLGYTQGGFSATDRTQLDLWIRARWRIPPTSGPVRIVNGIGDSIMAANGVNVVSLETKAYSHLNRACDWMGANWKANFNNWSVSGAQMGGAVVARDIPWQIANRLIPNLVSGQVNVCVLQGGINDFNVALPEATTWFSQFNNANTVFGFWATDAIACVSAMNGLAGGPHHLFVETISCDSSTSVTIYQDQSRQFCNQMIRDNYKSWATANVKVYLVDSGGDFLVGMPNGKLVNNNPNYFDDNEHPAKPGQDRWGTILMNAFISAGLA